MFHEEVNRVLPNRLQTAPNRLTAAFWKMFNAYISICQLNLQLTNWGSSMSFLGLHHAQVEIDLILIFKFYQIGTFFTFLNIFNVFWNVLRMRCFRVILKHILVFWRHFSLNIIKSSCCWSLFRLFDIGRQTLIWLKLKKVNLKLRFIQWT